MSTPIRRQYLELKQRHPDTILFFRLGDFYETFDDDAKLVADALQITLTSKPMGKDVRVPLAGVPYHSIDGHIAKLVALGHRVAICEQMADPSSVKGLVPRDVVRVVTAGTVTAETSLDPDAPNYLAALVERRGVPALALADITTGEVRLSSGEAAIEQALHTAPSEIIVEDETLLPPGLPAAITQRPALADLATAAILGEQFGDHAVEGLVDNEASAAALAHVVAYLRDTYPAALGALQRVRHLADEAAMTVGPRTLRNLDVFPAAEKAASLYGVLNRTHSAMGARLLREWLRRPLRDAEALGRRHDAVDWALGDPILREQAAAILRGIPDIGRLTGRVGARSASPRDLHALRHGLRATLDLAALLGHSAPPELVEESRARFASAADPLVTLDGALDPDPPQSFDEGGVIAAGFSPEIDTLRQMTRDARGYLLGLERLERERTGIKTLKVGHNRVFGYYIEVSAANVHLVPEHYQRRQTLVGGERYVTEELKEHEASLVGARDRLVELERSAYATLLETLASDLAGLQAVADSVALIDLVLALGEVASERGYVRPAFNDGAALMVEAGRHPVVEAALGPGAFVPNDTLLDGTCQVVILTGPNMSGKSTYLRQVALIALMAQAGSFVPASRAELPLFDRIFTRIGAQDDLAAGQSTFMVEMVETAQILHQATPQSLVVLDEVGRGTSTFDGMAIARSVVEFLHNRREVAARTLFATHYHELTSLADTLPRVQNAHVAVHEDGNEVVFEHRIVDGPSDRSYGIHVARLAGLPPAVVSRAEQLLHGFEQQRGPAELGEATVRSYDGFQPALFAPSRVEQELAALDIDAMTPLDAIQRLYELRAHAGEGARR